MNRCECGSYAINPNLFPRTGEYLKLCDVCYFKTRTEEVAKRLAEIETTQEMLSDLVKGAFREGYCSALDVSSGHDVNKEWKISESFKKLNEIEHPFKE